MARAISFIFEHAEELEVDTEGYSLWGGSAGARMAAWLGSYGPAAFGGDDLPQPSAVNTTHITIRNPAPENTSIPAIPCAIPTENGFIQDAPKPI